jgi:hypothetical protein
VVTVQLSGGHSVTGGLVAVDNDRDQEVAVLTTAYELRNPVDHLVYFLVRDVVAVAVHTPGRVRDVLSAGALPSPDSGEPVSRLQLRREFAPTDRFPLEIRWDTVPDTPGGLASLRRILVALRGAADSAQKDELGRRAFAQVSALRVEHAPGQALSVGQDGPGVIAVRTDLTAALPRGLDSDVEQRLHGVL